MKKLFVILLIFSIGIILTGCYHDDTLYDMELIDIKVYDVEGKEVFGEFKNSYGVYNVSNKTNNSNIMKLNSAAPVTNFLYINAKIGEEYKVEFIFKTKRNYEMNTLVLGNLAYETLYDEASHIECTDIINIDDQIIASYTFSNISEEYSKFCTFEWYDANDVKHRFSTKGSNKYIKGIIFAFEELDEAKTINVVC